MVGGDYEIVRVHAHFDIRGFFPGCRIEKAHVRAQLVDHHDAGFAGGIVEIDLGREQSARETHDQQGIFRLSDHV